MSSGRQARSDDLLQKHSYKVKIINPNRKSDIILCQLHGFSSRFESVIGIRAKLMEKF